MNNEKSLRPYLASPQKGRNKNLGLWTGSLPWTPPSLPLKGEKQEPWPVDGEMEK